MVELILSPLQQDLILYFHLFFHILYFEFRNILLMHAKLQLLLEIKNKIYFPIILIVLSQDTYFTLKNKKGKWDKNSYQNTSLLPFSFKIPCEKV